MPGACLQGTSPLTPKSPWEYAGYTSESPAGA